MRGSIPVRQPSGRCGTRDRPPIRTIDIQVGEHVITAASPLPDDLPSTAAALCAVSWAEVAWRG